MKPPGLRLFIVPCLVSNSFLLLVTTYVLAQGVLLRSRVDIAPIAHELGEQSKYATQYQLPPNQTKAYQSSIVALQRLADLLEDVRDIHFSIGVLTFPFTFITEIGLLALFRRSRHTIAINDSHCT